MSWKGNWGGNWGGNGGGGGWGKGGGKSKDNNSNNKNANASSTASKPQAAPAKQAPAGGVPKSLNNPQGKTPLFTVITNSKKDEIGVTTLVGDYIEIGTNHGRKYYQKVQEIPGHKDVKVFLYYWDMRDGADFAGWWFGDELGGSQVWARCSNHGNVPPSVGWKIPWDAAKAEPGLLSVNAYKGKAAAAPIATKIEKGLTPAATKPGLVAAKQELGVTSKADVEAKVTKLTNQIGILEKSSNAAAAKAKTLSKDSAAVLLTKNRDLLLAEQKKLAEYQKLLTAEIGEARKAGPTAVSSVTELSKLSPRVRTAASALNAELNKIKGFINVAESAKKNEANKEQQKKLEEKQAKELESSIPIVQEAVSDAEAAVEAVSIMAAPIVSDPPEDAGVALRKVMEEIESSANDAQKKITETRQQINNKLQAARNMSADARKKALTEFTALQGKLAEAQKKVNPYKNFKRDFQARVEAKKAVSDILEKLESAELEVEKASMMTTGADESQMSEEDVKASEGLVAPARAALNTVNASIEAKMKAASGPMKEELGEVKKRLQESQQKLNETSQMLKRQKEGLQLESVYKTAYDKVEKAEDAFEKCGEAELSFLKGIEVLPQDESEKAIKDSEAAAAAATTTLSQAQGYLRSQLQQVKKYSEKTAKKATDELNEMMKRCEAVQKKVTSFKAETQERKLNALMTEAVDAVVTAETKLKSLTDASKVFTGDKLEKVSVDALKTASAKAVTADKECAAAVAEARKIISQKQKGAAKDIIQGLSKLSTRISEVQQEHAKLKKAALTADKLVKSKESLVEAQAKLEEAEKEVKKIVKMSKPEDEGLGVETISDDSILDMDTLCTTVSKSLRLVTALVQSQVNSAPEAMKDSFKKLLERAKKADASVAEVRASTKDQCERVLAQRFVKEGLEKTVAIEEALDKTNEAEAPYLKGVEVLPLEESKQAMAAADEVSKVVQAAISAARTTIAQKNLEIKKFDATNVKDSVAEITKLTERVNVAAQKLGVFKKDTESRRKKALMQEAGEMVSAFESSIEKLKATIEPILEKDPDTLSPEEASTTMKNLEELEQGANKQMSDCRNFLAHRSREAHGDSEKVKQVQEYQAKLTAASAELGKTKKLSGTHHDKLKAKALVQEIADKVKEAQAELEKATKACAPVLEEKCERFLVKGSIATMCTALSAHMEEKGLSEDAMLKQMGKPLKQSNFVDFVGKMPEALKREECSFNEERRVAMFKSIDQDDDGVISIDEFTAMLTRKYTCIHSISITDGFDIGESKTLSKIEVGAVLECKGAIKKGEGDAAVPRVQCKAADGSWGWVSMQSNTGTKYLVPLSPFGEFIKGLDKEVDVHIQAVNKLAKFFHDKLREFSSIGKDSPLQAAKEEALKVRAAVNQTQQKIQDLKRQVNQAKGDFSRMEHKEKNAHIEAKEQKEADAVTAVVKPIMNQLEADMKKIEEAAKTLIELSGKEELQEFATPITVQDTVKAGQADLKKTVEEVKAKAKEQSQLEVVIKASKGPMFEAKKELSMVIQKSSQAVLTSNKVVQQVKACCNAIANKKFQVAASIMQTEFRASGSSLEESFKKLSKGKDRIAEEDFVTHVSGLKDLNMPREHVVLLIRQIEVGGIGHRSFMRFVQKHLKVVKEIAITPNFEVLGATDKPVRKADLDEVFEVLEGPKTDESSGLERVRVRALCDGAVGWVSTKGNQGRVFLESVEKPFYMSLKDVPLEKDFDSGSQEIQTLKADDVLELIEGPRKESLGCILRVKGKAVSDGKTGWFTIKDKAGNIFAEKGSKCYTCTASVAITDVRDIKACKVIKKLSVDDVFTITEGPVTEDGGIERVKGKADDAEGWITIRGNAGTCYAKVSEKLYSVSQDVALQSQFKSDSSTIRTLAAGEAIEVSEAPKEERNLPANRAKVRASSGGVEGWISVKSDTVKSWSPTYKFVKAGKLYSAKGSKEDVVRETSAGETLDLQEGPFEVDGQMWVCGSMKKDASVGWTPIKEDAGGRLLVNGH